MDQDHGISHRRRLHHHQEKEIVEISEDMTAENAVGINRNDEVYIAVGKNDLHVVKWALDHAVSPGTRVFLVHVFRPVTYISTPVGRLSRNQLSQEQARAYVNEDRNKRKNVLDKYIRLCNDANVAVDTMLSESNTTAKAIVDMISVVNITYLVMGTKRSHFRRHLRKVQGKGEYVQKNAPDFCEVNLVHNGQKIVNGGGQLQLTEGQKFASPREMSNQNPQNYERNFFECICFSRGKSNG